MSSNSVVELKGSMYTFLSLKLHSGDLSAVNEALAEKVQQAPGFFSNTPIVVDLTAIEDKPDVDAKGLLAAIRDHKLVPIVASVHNRDGELARDIDLPLVEARDRNTGNDTKPAAQASKKTSSESAESSPDPVFDDDVASGDQTQNTGASVDSSKESAETGDGAADNNAGNDADREQSATGSHSMDPIDLAMSGAEVEYVVKRPKLVTRPVRSGQQVYARDTDLVVLGQIGAGAEIIADNNIHVYGPLRGRALCGVTGNSEARIFCQSLEAELVSVAGNFKVLEEIPEHLHGKPAQIWFSDDKLHIEPL